MSQALKRYIYHIDRKVGICIIYKLKLVLMQISITDGIIKQTLTNVLLVGETKMMNCIIVGTGGFLGAVARYLIGLIKNSSN